MFECVRQNADLMRIVEQLDSEDVLTNEPGTLDNTAWPDHDMPLFPLVESELDNYWNSFDPFEGAAAVDVEDRCPVPGALSGRQEAANQQSPSLSVPPQQQKPYQPALQLASPGRKRPRSGISSPVMLQRCGDTEELSPTDSRQSLPPLRSDAERQRTTTYDDSHATRRIHQPSTSDIVVDGPAASAAVSSPSSIGIPLGLLSSLPPNCSVYITHRPASKSGQKSPPPVTQIIINHAGPSSTLPPSPPPPPSDVHYHSPCCMPSLLPCWPASPPADQRITPLPPATVNYFHPLDNVRPREPVLCSSSAPLAATVRPPKSLSTYAAEFRRLGAVGDVSMWGYEKGRRASDTAAETIKNSGDVRLGVTEGRHRNSSAFLPITKPVSKFHRPTSLPLSSPPVFRRRELSSCSAAASSQAASLSTRWRRGSVESQRPPTSFITPGDETDETVTGEASDSTADDCSSGASGSSYVYSDAVHHFCSPSSASSSCSSWVDAADLPSPPLSTDTATTASVNPRQRTIDALSKKIQRNQTRKTEKRTTATCKDASSARPDSSCPTPPLSRQITPSSFSSASVTPFDAGDSPLMSACSTSFQQHKPVLKNEYADSNDLSAANNASKNTSTKDLMLPSKRKRSAQQKSQTPANDTEKVGTTLKTFSY